MKKFFIVISIIVLLIMPTIITVKYIQFSQNCGGYLKQAADANSVELAIDRLNIAIDYIEENNLTSGYTSVIYRTEDENVGFWYKNIVTCRDELLSCINGTQFEQTNTLMKVRESLIDNGEKGDTLTIPSGISRYPNNLGYAILLIVGFILSAIIFVSSSSKF